MTHIIYQPRQTGKTTKLVKRAAKVNGQIICSTETSKRNILELAKKLNLNIHKPITIGEFMTHRDTTSYNKPLLIDSAEYILSYIFREKIDAITIDAPDTILKEEEGHYV